MTDITKFKNKIITNIVGVFDGNEGKVPVDTTLGEFDHIKFSFDDGAYAIMLHYQDCCESVGIVDICGDVRDLLGSPILEAEVVTDCPKELNNMKMEALINPDACNPDDVYNEEAQQWTFYKLGTIKGFVVFRWYGTSNGYYSIAVDIAYHDAN